MYGDIKDVRTAPAMVNGSITSIKSQSTNGRSVSGCRLGIFNTMLVIEEPNIVKLLSGIANLGWKSYTMISKGTKIPPPPTPPDAAIIKPMPIRKVPT